MTSETLAVRPRWLILGLIVFTSVVVLAASGTLAGLSKVNPILWLLIVIFVIPCLIAQSDFRSGFYIYLAILPFTYFLKRLLFLSDVTQIEWFIATALPDVLLMCALSNLVLQKGKKLEKSSAHLPVTLFLGWCVLEIFNPETTLVIGLGGFKKTAFYIAMYYLAAGVGSRTNTADERVAVLDKVGQISVYCGLIAATYGFFQAYFGMTSFEEAQIKSGIANLKLESIAVLYAQDIFRVFSTFSGPWVFGDYLVIGIMFNLMAYMRRTITKKSFYIISLWLGVGLLLSLSRSSYLMLILSLLTLYTLSAKSKARLMWRAAQALTVATVGLAVILLFWESSPSGMMMAIFAPHNLFGRMDLWQELLSGPSTFSLAGYGIGSSQASIYFGDVLVADPHSFVFILFLEVGATGAGLFLWGFIAVVREALKGIRYTSHESERLNMSVALSILFGMVIAKAFSDVLWGQHIHDNYLWMISGLLIALSAPSIAAKAASLKAHKS